MRLSQELSCLNIPYDDEERKRLAWQRLLVAASPVIHKFSTAAAPSSALTAFRSVDLLDGLHEYDCGGLGRKPCQDGAVTASLRKLMNCPG